MNEPLIFSFPQSHLLPFSSRYILVEGPQQNHNDLEELRAQISQVIVKTKLQVVGDGFFVVTFNRNMKAYILIRFDEKQHVNNEVHCLFWRSEVPLISVPGHGR